MLSLAAEIHPDDGIDPRELASGETPRKGDRKVRQLCAQVADTLSLVLSGEFGDSVLQSLHVVAVDPAPDASQLIVTVNADLPEEMANPAEVLQGDHQSDRAMTAHSQVADVVYEDHCGGACRIGRG